MYQEQIALLPLLHIIICVLIIHYFSSSYCILLNGTLYCNARYGDCDCGCNEDTVQIYLLHINIDRNMNFKISSDTNIHSHLNPIFSTFYTDFAFRSLASNYTSSDRGESAVRVLYRCPSVRVFCQIFKL